MLKKRAIGWLQSNIPANFWDRVNEAFCNINQQRRSEMEGINYAKGLSGHVSFMKHVSYVGAVRVPNTFPGNHLSWTDPKTGQGFLDPSSKAHLDAFRAVWPNTMTVQNQQTIGDLFEAVLGLAWAMQDQGLALPTVAQDFVRYVENLILAEYSLTNWYAH